MNIPLALHHFTLFDISPFELVPVAAKTGCEAVCIFVHSPGDPAPGLNLENIVFPAVARSEKSRFVSLLDSHGVRVTNIEFFPLGPDTQPQTYRPGLELGAELGARLAVTHVYDTLHDRALERLIEFAELAADYGLTVGLEFMGLSPGCSNLQQATDLVGRARKAQNTNIGIGVDAIHLHLTGGMPEDLTAVPAEFIAYAQLCDTGLAYDAVVASRPDLYLPAVFERKMPGSGMIPLTEFIRALPPGTHYDVEVPWPSREAHRVSAEQHALRSVHAACKLLGAQSSG